MIQNPHTYYEWVQAIELLKNKTDDTLVLLCLKQGTLEIQADVYRKIVIRLWDAVYFRIKKAICKFQRDIETSLGSEMKFIQSINSFKSECNYLMQILNIPIISEKERDIMSGAFIKQLDSLQLSLENIARKTDRSGKLLLIFKNNRVNISHNIMECL